MKWVPREGLQGGFGTGQLHVTAVDALPPGALPAAEAVQSEHHLRLEPVPQLVSDARAFVAEHAPALDPATYDNVVLLTSELVTNVVIHARTPLVVGVTVTARYVVVTVHDQDLGHAEVDPLTREGGRGMVLVNALAEEFGMYRNPSGGKTAWFRLPRDAADPESPGQEPLSLDEFLDGYDL